MYFVKALISFSDVIYVRKAHISSYTYSVDKPYFILMSPVYHFFGSYGCILADISVDNLFFCLSSGVFIRTCSVYFIKYVC